MVGAGIPTRRGWGTRIVCELFGHRGEHTTLRHISTGYFSNLQAWLNGTHHGVEPKYLQSYLDECVFRFNRRKTPMAAF